MIGDKIILLTLYLPFNQQNRMIQFLTSKHFLKHLVLAILLLLLLVFGTLEFLERYTLHGQRITVPDLSGLQIDEVESILSEKQLKYAIVDSVFEPQQPKGTVLEQDPEAEYLVKQNRTIYLTVNSFHPPRLKMPRLTDLSLRSLKITLENLGLKLGNTSYMPDQCTGCVLKQQINGKDVEAGQLINKGATVDVVLGMGLSDEKVLVPLLINLPRDSAVKVLQDAYLNLGAEIYDPESVFTLEDSMNARVYEQSPPYVKTSILALGSAVDIRLTLDSSKIDTNIVRIPVIDTLSQPFPDHDSPNFAP